MFSRKLFSSWRLLFAFFYWSNKLEEDSGGFDLDLVFFFIELDLPLFTLSRYGDIDEGDWVNVVYLTFIVFVCEWWGILDVLRFSKLECEVCVWELLLFRSILASFYSVFVSQTLLSFYSRLSVSVALVVIFCTLSVPDMTALCWVCYVRVGICTESFYCSFIALLTVILYLSPLIRFVSFALLFCFIADFVFRSRAFSCTAGLIERRANELKWSVFAAFDAVVVVVVDFTVGANVTQLLLAVVFPLIFAELYPVFVVWLNKCYYCCFYYCRCYKWVDFCRWHELR